MSAIADLEKYIDKLNLRYFRGAEFTPYWSRTRNGVKNSVPPRNLWPNIIPTLVVLDEIRHQAGASIRLNSTYRSSDYNRAAGGAKFSLHMQFNAIDFSSKIVTPTRLAEIARGLRGKRFIDPTTGKAFTFAGGVGKYPTFVHVDTRGTNADW